jgi:UDP-glucose 4-epimerase
VSTLDQITVNEIAKICLQVLEIDESKIEINYRGGDRGWKADVPIVKLSSEKLRRLGWEPRFSTREAVTESLRSMAKSNY